MNPRQIGIAVVVVAGVIATMAMWGGASPAPRPAETSEVGRYQLISGHYQHLTPSKRDSVAGLFKIDTRTGRVWEYVQLQDVFRKDGPPITGRWHEKVNDE